MPGKPIGPPLQLGVGRLLPLEHNRDRFRPRIRLRLKNLVEQIEAACRSLRLANAGRAWIS